MEIIGLGLRVDSTGVKKGVDELNRLERAGGKAERSMTEFDRSASKADQSMRRVSGAAKAATGVIAGLVGALGTREILNYSDAWNGAANQLRQVTSGSVELERVQKRLVAVAKGTRSNFEATANLYARLARSTTELNLSQEDLLDLTTTINESFAASGATAEEASNAITQLSQGLASGALRGDEFNSVAEQAPGIMRALAESLDMTIGELREFAATGGITAETVVTALQGASDTIANDFGKTIATFSQDMEVARTNLVEWVGTSEDVQGAISALGDGIVLLSENMDEIVAVGKIVAILYGARLVGSLAGAAKAMKAAASASVVLRLAMVALGGPVGVLAGGAGLLAAGLLYTFREELGLIEKPALDVGDAMEKLAGRIDLVSGSAAKIELSSLETELAEVRGQVDETIRKIDELREASELVPAYAHAMSGGRAGQGLLEQADREEKKLQDLMTQVAAYEATVIKLQKKISGLGEENERTSQTTKLVREETEESTEAAGDAVSEYERLRRSIDGNYDAMRQYANGVRTLVKARKSGEIQSAEELADAMDLLKERYREATEESESASQSMGDDAEYVWSAWDDASYQIDRAFQDLFRSGLEDFEDFADNLESAFTNLVADMAYAAAKNQIMLRLGVGGEGATGSAGAMGGTGLPGGSISSALNWGATQLGVGPMAYSLPAANPALTIGQQSALQSQSTMFGGGAMGYGLAGMGGGFIGASLFDGANSGLGGSLGGMAGYGLATGGTAIGSALGGLGVLGGPLGVLGGAVLGGALGDFFSTDRSFRGRIASGDAPRGGWENDDPTLYAESELGQFGFANAGSKYLYNATEENNREWARSLISAAEGIENFVASLAETDEELADMRDAVSGLEMSTRSVAKIANFATLGRSSAALSQTDSRLGEGVVTREEEYLSWSGTTRRQIVEYVEGSLMEAISDLDPQQATDAFVNVIKLEEWGNAIGGAVTDDIFKALEGLTGEALTEAISNIENARQSFALLADASQSLNLQFNAMASGAFEAAGEVSSLVGGIQNLTALQSSYYQNYYTEAEKAARLQDQLTAQFEGMNLALPNSRDAFRDLVEAQNLNTKSGRETYAQLLQVSGAFKELSGSLDANAEAIYRDLEKAIRDQQRAAKEALDDRLEALNDQMSGAAKAVREAEGIVKMLGQAVRNTRIESVELSRSRRDAARDLLSSRAQQGVIGDTETLERALNTVAQPSERFYGTFSEYALEQAKTAHDIIALEDVAKDELTVEEKTLNAIERQIERERRQYEVEVEKMNAQLEMARQQYEVEVEKMNAQLEMSRQQIETGAGQLEFLESINEGIFSLPGALKDAVQSAYAIGSASSKSSDLPAFASGGTHAGGWRIVGERGPELEYTGPSQIISSQQSAKMLNEDVVRELRELRRENASMQTAIAKHTNKSARQLERWEFGGMPQDRGENFA